MKQFFESQSWRILLLNDAVVSQDERRFGKLIIKNCSYIHSFFASNSATFGMRLFILNYTIVVKKNEVLLYKIYERPALYISSVWNIWRTWQIDELNYDVNIQQLTTRKKNGAQLPRLTIVCWFQNICVIVTDRIKSSHIFKIRLFKGSGKTQLIWDS